MIVSLQVQKKTLRLQSVVICTLASMGETALCDLVKNQARTGMGEMSRILIINDLEMELTFKRVRNLTLRVLPPDGKIRISAPLRMSLKTIHEFVISRQDWIRRQQEKMRNQPVVVAGPLENGNLVMVWGRSLPLEVREVDTALGVELQEDRLVLKISPGLAESRRAEILETWYQKQLRQVLPPLFRKWEAAMGVEAVRFTVKPMKSRWGSCTPGRRTIRINSELARRSPACLEYIVVHELAHLLEMKHDKHFHALLARFLPEWKRLRDELNSLPIG